jgi:plastocyanin
MRKNILLTFLFIIFILSMVTLALPGCAGSGSESAETRAMGAKELETAAKNEIIIKDNGFNPIIIAAKVGDTITWVNEDPFEHQVKDANGTFDSGVIAAGAKFSFTFTKEGTYEYSCVIHTFETGKINVLK